MIKNHCCILLLMVATFVRTQHSDFTAMADSILTMPSKQETRTLTIAGYYLYPQISAPIQIVTAEKVRSHLSSFNLQTRCTLAHAVDSLRYSFHKKTLFDLFTTNTIAGTENINGYSEFLDTLHRTVAAEITLDHSWKYYPLTTRYTDGFFSVSTLLQSLNHILYEKNYSPFGEDKVPDFFKTNRYHLTTVKGLLYPQLTLTLGYGRTAECAALYQTAAFERYLSNQRLLSHPLSKTSRLHLVRLLRNTPASTLSKFETVQSLKHHIDSILVADGQLQKSQLRYIAPLELRTIISRNSFDFTVENSVLLYTKSRVGITLIYRNREYPFDTPFDEFEDTTETKRMYTYEQVLGAQWRYARPLSQHFFFMVCGQRDFFSSTESHFNFFTDNHHLDWDKILEIQWDYRGSALIHRSVMLSAGCTNLSSWLCIPASMPHELFIASQFFVEGFLTIAVRLSQFESTAKNKQYLLWKNPLSAHEKGLFFTFSTLYNF
ncbi:MAG: hypothetical protein JW795_18855 [Chitinivibrionales bacterium]|nr:hypothetical protein [Chitinivibrionales bacterium]